MNAVLEAIKDRRSVRSYKPEPIPRDIINTIIEAGNLAPSRGRMEDGTIQFQPWRFVVVDDPEFRLKLVQTALPIWKKITEGMKKVQPEMYQNIMKQYEEP